MKLLIVSIEKKEFKLDLSWCPASLKMSLYTPAEVQQGSSWLRNILVHPGQEVELGYGTCLIGLDILQVETAHQEVLTPDVLWHQIDLEIKENNCIPARMCQRIVETEESLKIT